MSRLLAKHWLIKAGLNKTADDYGKTPPALAAIDRLATVVKTAADVIKLENSQGAISPELLDVIKRAIVDLIRRFVEPSRQDAARAFLRDAVSGGAGLGMGRHGGTEP